MSIARIVRIAALGLSGALSALAMESAPAAAQALGLATMQPGTLNHTTGTAIAKVIKEKAGLNALVQPTAGESVIIPLVGRGEAEFGIANALEVSVAVENNRLPELRLIGAIHPLPTAFFVRKDTTMRTIADLKGKKVVFGFSAQRTLDILSRAILATGGLTEADISPVLVPNVIRGADDFLSGAADTFYFAFGAPKVREVDATVGGIRALEISESGMPAARKIYPEGYLAPAAPGPFYIGVDKPMGVYTWDNLLFTNATVKDDVVYKLIEAMAKNKDDLVAVQPALRAFTPGGLFKKFSTPYHPGALKYFAHNKIEIKAAQ
ncbi:MAG: TAXI family TRAP transporter solute-binding subunit [Xanthobacteraceae bacterium]|nr:TAXI family TRAP transporter solute-binding subunit [Xanthobacteraceae bacterium]